MTKGKGKTESDEKSTKSARNKRKKKKEPAKEIVCNLGSRTNDSFFTIHAINSKLDRTTLYVCKKKKLRKHKK